MQQTVIVDCGYPYSSSSDVLTSVTFNEDGVLRGIEPSGSASSGVVKLFYNDEHAMTLGVRSVVVTSASGIDDDELHRLFPLRRSGQRHLPQTGTNDAGGRSERARSVAASDVAGAVTSPT